MKSQDEFIGWTHDIEKHNKGFPMINFLVAFVTFERYVYRTALAIMVFNKMPNKVVRKELKPAKIKALIKLCGNPKKGGNPEIHAIAKQQKLDKRLPGWVMQRNGIAHGFDMKSNKTADKGSEIIWELIRQISTIPFATEHKRGGYKAWQRLPIKRSDADKLLQ